MQVARGIPALLAIVVASGCAVGSSATPADDARALSDPVAQATSAVATATIAVELLGDDRVTAPVTDTALVDQIHVLEEAADAVSTLVPGDADGRRVAAGRARRGPRRAGGRRGRTRLGERRGRAGDVVHAGLDASADQLDELTTTLDEAGAS